VNFYLTKEVGKFIPPSAAKLSKRILSRITRRDNFYPMTKLDELFMREALKEAHTAADEDEVPVGAVVVYEGRVIARGHNQIERLKDPTAHAEMLALTSATNLLGTKWLNAAIMYVTIEPCSMCAGALVLARVKEIVFGAKDFKTGACGSIVNIASHPKLNHRIKLRGGVLQEECARQLSDFFKKKRTNSHA
jgi:tRNA(adenine34) deaminase